MACGSKPKAQARPNEPFGPAALTQRWVCAGQSVSHTTVMRTEDGGGQLERELRRSGARGKKRRGTSSRLFLEAGCLASPSTRAVKGKQIFAQQRSAALLLCDMEHFSNPHNSGGIIALQFDYIITQMITYCMFVFYFTLKP